MFSGASADQGFLDAFRDQHGVDAVDEAVAGADVADGDRCGRGVGGTLGGARGGAGGLRLVGAGRGRRFGLTQRRQGLADGGAGGGAVVVLECLGRALDGAASLLERLAVGGLELAAVDRLTGAGELVTGRLIVLGLAGERLIGVLQGAERVGQVLVGG